MADSLNTTALPLSQMSIADLVQIHRACLGIMEASLHISNMPSTSETVDKFLEQHFDNPAGELIAQIVELFKKSTTVDDNEIHLISSILIPYHMENENLERANAALAELIYRQSHMAKKAA